MSRHESALITTLRTGVFHVTTIEGYRGIRSAQAILPQFGDSLYSGSFAWTQGYISLFDFRNVTADQLDLIRDGTWKAFFPPQGHSFGIALEVDADRLDRCYLPPRVDDFPARLAIPFVEGWSTVAIDWSFVVGGFIYSLENGPVELVFRCGSFPEIDIT